MWGKLVFAAFAAACSHEHRAVTTPPQSVLVEHPPVQWQDIVVTNRRLNDLLDQVAVRHRRLVTAPSPLAAVGRLFAGAAPPPVAQPTTPAVAADPSKLVVEAWVELRARDVAATAAVLRARVEATGGRVVSENMLGPPGAAASDALEMRIPPGTHGPLLDWLSTLGTVESRRVLASDVSKDLVDQQLALDNLRVTMKRLEELAKRGGTVQDLLAIENEMTRVRGDIEKLEGEQRWLVDRVAFATVTVTIEREGGPVAFAPHARVHPGAHVAILSLLDPGTRPRTRVGGGIALHICRCFTLELDLFPSEGGDTRAVIATAGTGLYSSFFGDGERRYLNPYLGVRTGYGYLSGHGALVVAGELGLELYKQRYLLVEATARALAMLGDSGTDVALHATLGLEVPF
jgi:hypothetical protein